MRDYYPSELFAVISAASGSEEREVFADEF